MTRIQFFAALPLLFGIAQPAPDLVRFSVAEKTTVKKVFETNLTMTTRVGPTRVEGKLVPAPDDMSSSTRLTSRTAVTDQYVVMKDGRPLQVKRTFDHLDGQQEELHAGVKKEKKADEDEGEDGPTKMKSVFEGKSVLFTWNDKTSQFDRAFAGSDADAKLLVGLVEDMDFRGLLPGKPVSANDTWDLDPKVLGALFVPGGNTLISDEDAEEADLIEAAQGPNGGDLWATLTSQVKGKPSGKVQATYQGVRKIDEHRVGVIALVARLRVEGELKEKETKGKESVNVNLELNGELLWDLDAGRFNSLEARGKVTTTAKFSGNVQGGGKDLPVAGSSQAESEVAFKSKARIE